MFYASRNGKRVDVVEKLADAIERFLVNSVSILT